MTKPLVTDPHDAEVVALVDRLYALLSPRKPWGKLLIDRSKNGWNEITCPTQSYPQVDKLTKPE